MSNASGACALLALPLQEGATGGGDPWAVWGTLPPIDYLGLGLVLVLVALGLWRGLWWQVIRLLGLVAAVALARIFSPEVAQWLLESWSELTPRVAHGIAWGAVFLLSLGAASLLGVLGQKILETIKLGLVNRLAGAILGALTGVVVHVAVLVVLCQLAPEAFVARHVGGSYSERVLERTGSRWRIVLGAEAAQEIDRLLEAAGGRPLPGEPGATPEPAPPAGVPTGKVR